MHNINVEEMQVRNPNHSKPPQTEPTATQKKYLPKGNNHQGHRVTQNKKHLHPYKRNLFPLQLCVDNAQYQCRRNAGQNPQLYPTSPDRTNSNAKKVPAQGQLSPGSSCCTKQKHLHPCERTCALVDNAQYQGTKANKNHDPSFLQEHHTGIL
jgi:hypothetical protein